jgi:hypothetical protein
VNWIQKLFGAVDADVEKKLEQALVEGEYKALAEVASVALSRMMTLKPENSVKCQAALAALGADG